MSDTWDLPKTFVNTWNDAAADRVIDAAEFDSLRKTAEQTPSMEDDSFVAELDKMTSPAEIYKNAMNERDRFVSNDTKGLQSTDQRDLLKKAGDSGLNINGITIWTNSSSYITSYEYSYDSRTDTSNGFKDVDIGYQRSEWNNDDTQNGLHLCIPYAFWRNPYLALTAEMQTNMLFSGFALTVGAGPGLHIGYYDFAEAYGKFMANGNFTTDNVKETTGWSANAVAGIKILFAYAEMVFPVTGGGLEQDGFFSIGLRGTINGTQEKTFFSNGSL